MTPRTLTALFVTLAIGAIAPASVTGGGALHHGAGARLHFDETTGVLAKRVQIPSFPSALGRLEGVRVELILETANAYGVENLTKADAYAQTQLSESFAVLRGGTDYLVGVPLNLQRVHILEPFDSVVDFTGPSGHTEELAFGDTFAVELPPDLGWTDLGAGPRVGLDLSGMAMFNATAPGELSSYFKGEATLRVEVTYYYS